MTTRQRGTTFWAPGTHAKKWRSHHTPSPRWSSSTTRGRGGRKRREHLATLEFEQPRHFSVKQKQTELGGCETKRSDAHSTFRTRLKASTSATTTSANCANMSHLPSEKMQPRCCHRRLANARDKNFLFTKLWQIEFLLRICFTGGDLEADRKTCLA